MEKNKQSYINSIAGSNGIDIITTVDVLAAVKNGMFLSVSYTDKDGNNNKEGTENTVPNESEQSEGAEPVQNEETGAASNSGVQGKF